MAASSDIEPRTASSLRGLLANGARYTAIASYLDALAADERVAEVLTITGRGVKRLYEAVGDGPKVSVDEFIAPTATETIIYEGRNSLPLFSRFQKRFARVGDGIIGYNHQTMAFVTGPGYFVVRAPSGEGEHGSELLFDYTVAPGQAPAGWPAYKPNDRGLSRPVYMNMLDYVRRVARGVYVGKAYKLGVDQDAFFSLSRAV